MLPSTLQSPLHHEKHEYSSSEEEEAAIVRATPSDIEMSPEDRRQATPEIYKGLSHELRDRQGMLQVP